MESSSSVGGTAAGLTRLFACHASPPPTCPPGTCTSRACPICTVAPSQHHTNPCLPPSTPTHTAPILPARRPQGATCVPCAALLYNSTSCGGVACYTSSSLASNSSQEAATTSSGYISGSQGNSSNSAQPAPMNNSGGMQNTAAAEAQQMLADCATGTADADVVFLAPMRAKRRRTLPLQPCHDPATSCNKGVQQQGGAAATAVGVAQQGGTAVAASHSRASADAFIEAWIGLLMPPASSSCCNLGVAPPPSPADAPPPPVLPQAPLGHWAPLLSLLAKGANKAA